MTSTPKCNAAKATEAKAKTAHDNAVSAENTAQSAFNDAHKRYMDALNSLVKITTEGSSFSALVLGVLAPTFGVYAGLTLAQAVDKSNKALQTEQTAMYQARKTLAAAKVLVTKATFDYTSAQVATSWACYPEYMSGAIG